MSLTPASSVLYVGGMGRSGSTLLERALAQVPGVCGVGESVYMWERGVINDERCGCGLSFSKCKFWNDVGNAGFGGWDQVDVPRIAQLQRSVDDVKYVPGLLIGVASARFREEAVEYLSYYERLYDAVRQVSGCEVIVDSSKITSLAYLLNTSASVDLKVVHMLRDPRAVAYSWTKTVRRPEVTADIAYMPRYSPAYMGFLYSGHHVLLEALRLRGVSMINLRYEDFAETPLSAIRSVAEFSGLTWTRDEIFAEDDFTLRLNTVHTASGNPSRFKTGDVAVRRDDKWVNLMPRWQQAVVSTLTLPLLVAYGYQLRPESREVPFNPAAKPRSTDER